MVNKIIKHSQSLLFRQSRSILSAALIIAVSYLASAGLGLIRNRLLAARFFGGLETQLDAYFAAFVIPDTLFQLLIVGALSVAFIPVYTRYLKKGDSEANHLVNATLNLFFLILLIVTTLLFIFAVPVSQLIAHFPPNEAKLMANLMRIMLISQLFFTLSSFLTGVVQAHRRFLIPAVAPVFYNLGTILGILFLTPYFGIYGPAIGIVFGAFLHALVQLPLAYHLGFRYKPLLDLKHEGVAIIRRLMLPRSASLAVTQLEGWIGVFFASRLAAGSLSMLNFSRQLYTLPISLFGISLGQASFPTMSSEAADNQMDSFRQTLKSTLLQIFFFALPASVILLILRVPIVRIVFGAHTFPWEATLTTAKAVAILSLTIAPEASTHIFIRAFHSLHDSKTPLYVSLTTIVVNIALSYFSAITFGWGLPGIALAISVSNFLSALLLYLLLRSRVHDLSLFPDLPKMLLATVFTGIFLWIPMRLLDQFVFDTTHTFPLILLSAITTILGLLVYFALCVFLRLPQLEIVKSLFAKVGNWRRILTSTDEVMQPSSNE